VLADLAQRSAPLPRYECPAWRACSHSLTQYSWNSC
jgi:hypothetical protein